MLSGIDREAAHTAYVVLALSQGTRSREASASQERSPSQDDALSQNDPASQEHSPSLEDSPSQEDSAPQERSPSLKDPTSQLSQLLDGAMEGDGAFYLSTDSVWSQHTRTEAHLQVRVFHLRGDHAECVASVTCTAPNAPLAPTTLLVQSDANWDQIRDELRAGKLVPIIVGPRRP